MNGESEKFVFDDVEQRWLESREIPSSSQRPAPTPAGINSATVSCKACGHHWTARRFGKGAFTDVIGGQLFKCPSCKTQEVVRGLH